MVQKIRQFAKDVFPEVVAIRRRLHKYPELSFQEYKTSAFIHDKLTEWGISHSVEVAGTGVVLTIKGKNPDKYCVALRADMDALPIEEQKESDYRSEIKGVMHACGHDAHTAMMLGVANILDKMKSEFEGSVKIVFQPAEEKLPGGAKAMMEECVLDGVDAIIAQHVYPDLPYGEVGFCQGPYMASCDEINIKIKGKGGHAAKPSERTNTVMAAAKILVSLEQLSSEFDDARQSKAILAFGSFIADGTYNVIPDEVGLKGTLRTFDEDVRNEMKQAVVEMSSKIAAEFGAEAESVIETGYPTLLNDLTLTSKMKNYAEEYLGVENVKPLPQLMTAEDFAYYTHSRPACFYRLGTSNTNKGISSKQHTSTFDIDEEAMENGVGLMVWLTLKILENSMNE